MVRAIVAVDKNWGIGYKNKLLFRIPADMKRFKELTEFEIVIMGWNTFLSLNSKPLPYRINIVISHDYIAPVRDNNGVIFMNMSSAIDYIHDVKSAKHNVTDVYIIGGESIYKQLLPYCDEALITKYEKEFEADTHFPNLDSQSDWEYVKNQNAGQHEGVRYTFMTYKRVNKQC